MYRTILILNLVCAVICQPAFATINLPHFFSDHAVLQRETGAKVWGWANKNAEVKVSFADQELSTKANDQGKWEVTFHELKATDKGSELTIVSGEDTKVLRDIVVGEVWLASGQSNMEWRVERSDGGQKEIEIANDPLLRIFTSANVASRKPQPNWWGRWAVTHPKQTKSFTAVGYYYGKRLRAELNVPIGIIECAWGGMPVESFTSVEALRALPEAKSLLKRKEAAIKKWNPKKAKEEFAQKKEKFSKKLALWKKNKKGKKPRGPRKPMPPYDHPKQHSNIYNGMIAPLVGYGIRGVIWYQGESNAYQGMAHHYQELLGCLVQDWRRRWGSQFSFYWVQLANFRKASSQPGVESHWVTVQDEMRRAMATIHRGGMVITNDIGDASDIHPGNKKEVGERLARWALAKDYGKAEITLTGPIYQSMEKKGPKILVTFDHAPGLKSKDGKPLKRFEIAGPDGKWQWAQAAIEDGKVVVWHDKIKEPAKVRYAWASNPAGANLVNEAGLPASCFTTE